MTSNSDGSDTCLIEEPITGNVEANDQNKSVRRLLTSLPEQRQQRQQQQQQQQHGDEVDGDVEDEDDDYEDKFSTGTSTPTPTITRSQVNNGTRTSTRQKQPIKYIENKTRRHVTFSKRRHGIMKKAYELSVLTGANILLLILANSGLVYTFTTPKLEPVVREVEGKNLIRACINATEATGAPDISPAQEQSPTN